MFVFAREAQGHLMMKVEPTTMTLSEVWSFLLQVFIVCVNGHKLKKIGKRKHALIVLFWAISLSLLLLCLFPEQVSRFQSFRKCKSGVLPQVFLPTQACQCSPTDQCLVFILTFDFVSPAHAAHQFDEMSELSLQLSVGSSWSACFATNQTIREMRSTGNTETYCSTLMKPFSWVIKHSFEIICESLCVLLKRTAISDSIFNNSLCNCDFEMFANISN